MSIVYVHKRVAHYTSEDSNPAVLVSGNNIVEDQKHDKAGSGTRSACSRPGGIKPSHSDQLSYLILQLGAAQDLV